MFKASYDAWGNQTVEQNDIDLRFGYCGHEMLPEFRLIDMGGRVYDPVLGRFLSCDNYVQEPDNSQNFNRYSYCLNNPLRYTDPSGEFWNLVVGGIIGGVFNWVTHGCEFNASGLGYFGVGALAGVVGTGLSSGISASMAGGSFWSGAIGATNASATGFLAGAASGACSGFAGGFITSAGNSWVEGRSFWAGLGNGLTDGGIGALTGGITGGIAGGLDARSKGCSFWDGTATFSTEGAYYCKDCYPNYKVGEKTISGKYVGTFEDIPVFESKNCGSLIKPGTDGKIHYKGVTVPERGIIVGEGVFTSGKKAGTAMMQHEFGHILQYRIYGAGAYWHVIAPESFINAACTSTHDKFWTETYANYLSKNYFGNAWIGGNDYPIKNISFFNETLLKACKSIELMQGPRGCF